MSKDNKSVNNVFIDKLDNDTIKKIESLYKRINKTHEFEFMFFNYKHNKYNNNAMGFDHFLRVIEYMKYRSSNSKLDLENSITLDIIYNKKDVGESYRVTVNDMSNVNKYMEMLHNRKNHVIFSSLVKMINDPNKKELSIIKKKKNPDDVIDIDDLNIRVRLADETFVTGETLEMLSSLNEEHRNDIIFRSKHRVSLVILNNDDIHIRIDLTTTQQNNNINRLHKSYPKYELEVDISSKKGSPNIKYMDTVYKEITGLLKVLQQSNYIVTFSYADNVLKEYASLLGVPQDKMKNLEGRKAQSLEIQHVIEQLPNKYAVTDKADGDRYFLIILDGKVLLISDNLNVKDTGIIVDKKYNKTIFDGEYIFISTKNKHMFMVFDCLYASGKDVRETSKLMDRLKYADDIINECFIIKGQEGYVMKNYEGDFNVDKIIDFHSKQIAGYMKALHNDLDKIKGYPLIRRKYFMPVLGGKDNEIFKYSELLWKKYVFDKNTMAPYILDGLMFHPLDQKYITSVRESKYLEYKWKPPTKNSIDFYVEFEKNNNGDILTLYDNSNDDFVKGKPYRIALLHVGKKTSAGEQPILFQQEQNKYQAYLFLEEGQVRDHEGYVIQDNTVVEFSYNNDLEIPDKYRWVPLRTRHDKTEAVRRHGIRFGNYYEIANKVWRSISNPFVIEDIQILGNDNTFTKHLNLLRNKIDHSVIMSEYKENIYHQIKSSLAKPMRNFHNWMMSITLYTYCNPVYDNEKQLNVLDLKCERGKYIMQYYYTKVNMYVGLDTDYNGIISPTDGAISRYNQLRKTHPNFPNMFFMHADPGAILDYEEQLQVLGSMTDKNKGIINKFFSLDTNKRMGFDRINCLSKVSEFLINDTIWNNFIENIKMYLKPGGFLILMTFDAESITNLLKDKDQYAAYYTNAKGEKVMLIDIVKKYETNETGIYGTGNSVDIYNSLVSQENVYITEYLVDKKFIEKELNEKCNMELVDSDLYSNQFQIHTDYFKNVVKFEENVKTREFLLNAAEYYKSDNQGVNKACFEITKLNRYYVFRKRDGNSDKEFDNKKKTMKRSTKKNMKGGANIQLDDISNYLEPSKYIKREMNSEYSLLMSIYDVLTSSNIVPTSVTFEEFYRDIKYKLCSDSELSDNEIKKLCKSLIIEHELTSDSVITDSTTETTDKTKNNTNNALNGINIIVLEKDCDDDTSINTYSKNKSLDRKTGTILLLKTDGQYNPIYRIRDENTFDGLFDTRTKLIKRLVDGVELKK